MDNILKCLIGVLVSIACFASPLRADDELAPLADAISTRVQLALGWPPTPAQSALQGFYEERGYTPLWVNEAGFNSHATALVEEMAKADDWGLTAANFHVQAPQDTSDASLADAEVALSRAILNYVDAARGGRIAQPSQQLSSYLDRRPALPNPLEVLRGIASSAQPGAYLLSFHPQHEQFTRLRAAYVKLRAEEQHARAAPLPEDGPDLLDGVDHPQVGLLKARLGLSSAGTMFDSDLAAAVKRFQREAGLNPVDGIVGPRTRKALNVSDASKLSVLRANMEQWRWMPADLGTSHVMVNIPEFKAELVKDHTVAFSERVIVGTDVTQTPVFSQNMKTVVLRPRWIVPETIKLKEFLPSLLRGRSLESRGFVLLRNGKPISSRRVNWEKADIRNFDVYQSSGDDNALGQMKFLFPNQHSVYLHDTPNRGLFNSNERTFSHGCVRLRNPLKFAELLLNADKGWSDQQVKDLTEKGPFDNAITLDKPLPVHITYFTAWVDDDGTLRVMSDVYGHQKRVSLALEGRWSEIDKGKDHLAPVDMAEIKRSSPRNVANTTTTRVKQRSRPRSERWERERRWAGPMGVFGTASTAPRRRYYGPSPSDIFRQFFGN